MLLETHGSRARGRERAVLCCVLGTLAPALGPAKSTAHDDRPAGCRLPRLLSTTQRTEARLAQMCLLLSGVLGKFSEPAFSRNAYLRSCAACAGGPPWSLVHLLPPSALRATHGQPMVLGNPWSCRERPPSRRSRVRITSHTRLWCALREPRRGERRGGLCARRFFTSPACVSVTFISIRLAPPA
jgi:hypothetical protein